MRTTLHWSLAFLLAISLAGALQAASADSPVITVAVAPFANISKDTQTDWLGYGFAETLATKLCMVPGIQYVERSELSKALKELKLQDTALVDPATASKLGKIVGAEYVIVGSFQKIGDALKVDARVVNVETSVAAKSADDTGTMPGVFELQASLATKLVTVLGRKIPESSAKRIAARPTQSMSSYEWFCRALAAQTAGKWDDAIEAWTNAILLDPQAAYYMMRASVYLAKDDPDRAIDDFTTAIAFAPDTPAFYTGRASAYETKHEYDKAIADCDKALEIKPEYAEAYCIRAHAYGKKGDWDKSIADFGRAIAIEPSPNTYTYRGLAWFLKHEPVKAIGDYDRAIAIAPGFARAYLAKGLACEEVGRSHEARAAYQYIISLDNSPDLVKEARKRLEQLPTQ